MKGFGIHIKNDLLDPKHWRAMRESVWLFMWLIDKMTSISEEGVGKILGGRPITSEEITQEIGCSDRTYRTWLSLLVKGGYVNKLRSPNGLILTVNKAFKPFKGSAVIGRGIGSNRISDRQRSADAIKKQFNTYTRTIQNENTIKINTGMQPLREILKSRIT